MSDDAPTVDPVSDLFRAPLEAFVQTRKALVAELRKQGRPADARALAKRKRPSPAAWAVNQLYYRHRDAIDRALTSARALAAAYANRALTAEALQAQLAEQRAGLQALCTLAQQLTAKAGAPLSRANERKLRDTLNAVLADPSSHALGQLDRDLPAPTLDGLGALGVPLTLAATPLTLPAAPAPPGTGPSSEQHEDPSPTPPSLQAASEDANEARRLRNQAQVRARDDARQQLAAARAALEDAHSRVTSTHERVLQTSARVTGLAAQVASLEGQLAAARRRLDAEQGTQARVTEEHARAQQRVRDVQAEERAAQSSLARIIHEDGR